MRKILYTAIIGNYDVPLNPPKQEGWRYILFTDRDITSSVWEVQRVSGNGPDNKLCRQIKLLPHVYLPDHDISVWMDANLEYKGNLDELIKDKTFATMVHPERSNVFDEARECIRIGKDNPRIINSQIKKYIRVGWHGKGMVSSGLLIRKNTIKHRAFNEAWWQEVVLYSRRDQLSFNYVAWSMHLEFQILPFLPNITYHYHL